jgi:hypothetical protein
VSHGSRAALWKGSHMRRSIAEDVLDHVRVMLASREEPDVIERWLRQRHGIEPFERCPGSAHDNLHIDNCSQCLSPHRWGWQGEKVKIT